MTFLTLIRGNFIISMVSLLLIKKHEQYFLVEDDQAIREILETVLISENYDVRSFSTVRAFAQRDHSVNPDLYILDVMLPDGSGIDLCAQLKKDIKNKDVPIIIMSAHAQLRHFSALCQPNDFISKPFDIDNLLMKVQEMLDKN